VAEAPSPYAPGRTAEWRESVLRGMLTAAAVVTPALAALALFIPSSPRFAKDYVVLVATGIALP
jgi:hypothetical protein